MTPRLRHSHAPTSLGPLLLVAQDQALVGCYFPGHTYPPTAEQIGEPVELEQDAVLTLAATQLREYLAGDRREFTVPLAPRGDQFNQQVWTLLTELPYGATTSYGALARQLGNPHLAQRVGQAVGHNPISILIGCHRVLGSDGSLTGFAGGLTRKRQLLELEESDQARAQRLF